MAPSITLTPEFARAFDTLEHGRENIFLTGKAGTGKSTFLQYFREHTKKNIAVVAPTGVAALNVQGQTIHSFFRLPPRFVDIATLKPMRSKVMREVELLIIDEISMVRADVLDGIDARLRAARRNSKPFGGIQICAIGDLFQLPPVVSNDEEEFFAQFYDSPHFFSSKAYQQAEFTTVEFATIHRQQDEHFIEALNAVRIGECTEETLALLNTRVLTNAVAAPGTLVLTTTNAIADHINHSRLESLSQRPRTYTGEVSEAFGLQGARLPAPEQLHLKVGAQVMFVKNDTEGRWVNGSLGMIEALMENSVLVKTGSGSYEVACEKWESIAYELDEEQGKIVEKVQGTYRQFPLQLAWAITIHKSQGKTLDRAIIDLGRGAFAPGQLYVALSRCKSLSGIALKKPITFADSKCDERVVEFMRTAYQYEAA